MLKKYKTHLSRNFQNKNFKTISSQNTINHFFLRKKNSDNENNNNNNNNNNQINRNNLKLKSYIPNDRQNSNYFSSRNINHGPVKVLSLNEDNFKNLINSSSLNLNSSITNQNSLSNRVNSKEKLSKFSNKTNKKIHIYTSPERNKLNDMVNTIELSPNKIYLTKYLTRNRSNDFSNNFHPLEVKSIYKRDSVLKKKRKNFSLNFRGVKQLSKISEKVSNNNIKNYKKNDDNINENNNESKINKSWSNFNNEVKFKRSNFRFNSCKYDRKNSLFLQLNNENNNIKRVDKRRKTLNPSSKKPILKEEKKINKIYDSITDDEYFILNKINDDNDFILNNIIVEKNDICPLILKPEQKLLFFEEQINNKTNIYENLEIKKNEIIEKLLINISEYFLVKEKEFNMKTNKYFIKKNTSLKKEKNTLFKQSIFKNTNRFSYKIHKKKKIKNNYQNIDKNFPGEYIFSKYFEINIINQINEKYFIEDFKENENETLIKNFSRKTELKRLNNINTTRNSILSILIPNLEFLPKEDFYYIIQFNQIDYEYFIIPHTSSVKITEVKFRFIEILQNIKNSNSIIPRNKINGRRRSLPNNFILHNRKEDLKNLDKQLLKKALKKNNYFKRKKLPNKKNLNKKKENKKKDFETNENIINKKHIRSSIFDLKKQIFNHLKNHLEEVIFYIKDRNYPNFVQTFEKYKINPDSKDINDDCLLILAVKSNSFQIVNYLLNVGANPNTNNRNNNTPLHFALTFHNFEIADMLIKRGADEKAINAMGFSPWQCLDNGISII